MKKLAVIFLFLTVAFSAFAVGQRYVTDNLSGSEVTLYTPASHENGASGYTQEDSIKVPNGVELTLVGDVWHYCGAEWGIVEYDGKQYAVSGKYLRYVADNEAKEGNVLQNGAWERYHSALGHFYKTYTPFIIILILMIAVAVMMGITMAAKKNFLIIVGLFAIAGLLLVACLMEFGALRYLDDSMWWISFSAVGAKASSFGRTMLLLIPLLLVVVIQIISGVLLRNKIETITNSSLPLKSFFWVIAPFVACFLFIIIMAICGLQGALMDTIGILIFLGGTALVVFLLWVKSGKAIGAVMGLGYTIFGVVWAVGSAIAAWITVVTVIKLFIAMLVWIAIAAGAIFLMSKFAGSSGGGVRQTYYDKNGGQHSSMASRDATNNYIDSRKEE